MEEPSVLDYIKAKLAPWRGQKIEIPPAELPQIPEIEAPASGMPFTPLEVPVSPTETPDAGVTSPGTIPVAGAQPSSRTESALPWRSLLAIVLALVAQISLEPGPCICPGQEFVTFQVRTVDG